MFLLLGTGGDTKSNDLKLRETCKSEGLHVVMEPGSDFLRNLGTLTLECGSRFQDRWNCQERSRRGVHVSWETYFHFDLK